MYFFMVMFVGLSMLGPAGVRVHGAQWAMFSATLFVVLALGLTAPTTTRFIVVLVMNAVLAAIFLLAHRAYSEDQVEAIKTVAAGPTNPHVANDPAPVSALTSTIESVSARYGLSEREREVLAMLAQGRSRAHIGDRLGLANGTAGTYISRIYEKMRVHSKQELLAIVYDEAASGQGPS